MPIDLALLLDSNRHLNLIEVQHADNTVLATLCPTDSYIDPGEKLCVACLPGTYPANRPGPLLRSSMIWLCAFAI